jgi:peptidoglycan/LPS O-acetylase OafA/YrhL
MKNESIRSMLPASSEIRPMTGVRGIAALSVVAVHFFDHLDAPSRPWRHAYLAVDLFFMLSGLVLALTYSSTVTIGAGRGPYFTFIKKRIARIFPLYISVTLVQIVFDLSRHIVRGVPLPDTWEPKAMIANLLLVQSWGFANSIVIPAWSLSTELAAYVLFPVLVALAIQSGKAVAWAVAAASVVLLLAASAGSRHCVGCNGFLDLIDGDTPYPLMRCVAGFTLGLLAYRLVKLPRILSIVSSNLFAVCSVTAAIVAFYLGHHDLVVYVLLFATVVACCGSSKAANFMFGNSIVYFLGTISFSIYLVHMLLFPAVRRVEEFSATHFGAVSGVVSVAVLFSAVLVLATASYYLIEVPGKQFMMNLMLRKARKNAERSSASAEGIDAA